MRVVLDTNVYVSMALRSTALKPMRTAWETRRFSTVVSRYLLAEVQDVLLRDKFAPFIDPEAARRFLEQVAELGEPVVPRLPHPEFRDPKDRYLLAMLRDSNADVLVTGDKALLLLKSYESKPVLTPGEFMSLLQRVQAGADSDT